MHRIVDEDGNDVPRDANGERTGELLFMHKDGTPFKVEYYRNPEASAQKCAGGWLHMGDVVREDKDGWLYFLHGWTQVVAQVLHTPIEGELFERLAKAAGTVR